MKRAQIGKFCANLVAAVAFAISGTTLADSPVPTPAPPIKDEHAVTDPKADCQALLNSVLPFAEQMLTQHGAFYPFGGAIQADGRIAAVGGDIGTEHPDAREMASFLKGAFTAAAKQGTYIATALVTDSTFTYSSNGEKTDAISVALDHRDSYSVVVIIPYKLVDGKLTVGTTIAQKGAGDVFLAQ